MFGRFSLLLSRRTSVGVWLRRGGFWATLLPAFELKLSCCGVGVFSEAPIAALLFVNSMDVLLSDCFFFRISLTKTLLTPPIEQSDHRLHLRDRQRRGLFFPNCSLTLVCRRTCSPGSTLGTSRCFSAHTDQNVFHCLKCGRSGNALDLWSHATQQTPYGAAIDLCRRLNLTPPVLAFNRNREEEPVAPS